MANANTYQESACIDKNDVVVLEEESIASYGPKSNVFILIALLSLIKYGLR